MYHIVAAAANKAKQRFKTYNSAVTTVIILYLKKLLRGEQLAVRLLPLQMFKSIPNSVTEHAAAKPF